MRRRVAWIAWAAVAVVVLTITILVVVVADLRGELRRQECQTRRATAVALLAVSDERPSGRDVAAALHQACHGKHEIFEL